MIKSLRLRMVKALIPCFSLLLLASLFSEINAQSVTGKVFRDFDASGQQTTASPAFIEPGVPGVTVKAFNVAGTQIGAAVQTALDGTYTLPVATTNQVRIEFSNFPAAFFSGPKGALSGTSVQFVNGGSSANLGINYPSDYCGITNPKLVTPCYVNGTPLNGGTSANDPFIVTVPYTPNLDGVATATSENGYLSKGSEVGATWGMAYQRSSKFIFTSALLKRHSGFGNGGPGAIYKIDVSGGTQVTSLFVDLNADLSVSAGTDPRNPLSGADSLSKYKTAPNRDSTAFGLVGKMSLGDIDISDDEKTLWVINTFDRKLYELPIGSPATKPTTKITHTLPNPGCVKGVFRPWATKFWRGKIYVGGICTAENGGDSTNLRAYIYSFIPNDANPNNFKEEFSFPLNYPRGYTSISSTTNKTSAAWRPWIAQWADITKPSPGNATYSQTIHPQPILSDIEFDVDGSMILGFMDRAGHQLGNNNYSTLLTDNTTTAPIVRKVYEGASAGDLLRAGMNTDGTFTLESNATVNGVVSGGTNQNPAQGPSGGEFYWQDMYGKSINKNYPDGSLAGGNGHQEISLGGVALFPGKNEVVETVFDPLAAFRAGGVRWFDNTDGSAPRAYQIYGQDGGPNIPQVQTFGKANGLGDLELMCANQPIEVGNRLWNDTNKNGIQDADEPALTGVTVQLFKNGVQVGANVTTNATTGEFYFTGLIANMSDYEIRIPNVKGASKQAKLAGLDVTIANVGTNGSDLIDSDGTVTGTNTYASIPFTTGNAGENLHALDAGFSCVPPVAKPVGITGDVKICDPKTTYTLPAPKTGADAETWNVITSASTTNPLIDASGNVTGMTVNGKYTFVLTNTNTGCTDTVSIIRSPIPMAGADQVFCSPTTTASLIAANVAAGQKWSVLSKPSSATTTAVSDDGKVINMTADGVYMFKITQGDCSDDVQITIKSKPVAGNDITICDAAVTTANLTNVTGTAFTWSVVVTPANPTSATVDASTGAVAGITVNGTYRFALSSNGCSDTVSVVKGTGITVKAENFSICAGGNLSLMATVSPANATVTYFWSGPSGFTSNQQNPVIANISNANMGNYTVTVSAGTCSAMATSKATLNAITIAAIGGFTNVCVGQNLNLRDIAERSINEPKPQTYFWSGPNNFTANTPSTGNIMTTDGALEIGEYSLTETYPDGCVVTAKLTPTAKRCLSLGNLVWNDANNDGLNNNGELGVGNVPVRLYLAKLDANDFPTNVPDGAAIKSTTTNATTGKYLFSDLIPGSYLVEIDAPTGYKTSTGKNGFATGPFEPATMANDTINDNDDGSKLLGQTFRTTFVTINNSSGPVTDEDKDRNTDLTIDFGIFKPASIGDFVWSDTDKDGVQDASEVGVKGIIVNIYAGSSTTVLASTITDDNGKYLFDNLIPGTYTVEFVKSSIGASNSFSPLNGVGSSPTTDSNADFMGKASPVTVAAGEFNSSIDAGIIGNCPSSTIGTITVPNLCVGATLTMKAISSDLNAKYAWSSSATTPFSATTQEVTLSALTTSNSGVYTVTITNSNQCTSALTANVVVNPLPTVTATGAEFCEGKTGTITASGATTYSWSGPSPFVTTSTNPAIVSKSGIYTVIGTLNGCSAQATANVKVNLNPVLTATGATICLGGSATVSVLPVGLASYAWSGPNPFITTQQSVTITNATIALNGTYSVAVMDDKTCFSSATIQVSVGNALAVTPTSTSPVCAGKRLELGVNGGTGATYLWTSPSGVTSNLSNPFTNMATASDKGVWTVEVTSADGCKGTGSTNVIVNPVLTGVTATVTAPACAGGDVTLTSTPTGAKSYEWSGTPTFTSSVQNPSIVKPSAGNYTFTVKVTDLNGCSAVATASTAIYALPTASASSNTPVCFDKTIQLTGITTETKYEWNGPDNFNSSVQSPSIANATLSKGGTYTFKVINSNSCVATATTSVTVSGQLNVGNDLSICTPVSTAQLTLISGATYASDVTNPSATTIAINNVTGIVSGLNSVGTYVFNLTNTSGCKASVKVFVNAKLDAGPDKVICSPKSTISLLTLNGGQLWRYYANGSTLPAPTVTSNNVTGINQDGKYLFILEQAGNTYCADTIVVERKPSPNAGTDQVGASGGICESQTTAQLTAAGNGQTWSVASNSVGFGIVTIDAAGKAKNLFKIGKYLFVLTQGECTDTVMVERKARSSAGLDMAICEPETSAVLATALTGEIWSAMTTNPSSAIFGTNGKVSGLTSVGIYEFVLTSANGCTDTTKVTRFARPNAGIDLVGNKGICEPSTTAKLPVASIGTTWKVSTATASKPSGTNPLIDPATGVISGLTANGTYEFVLQNTTTLCSDTVKVERSMSPNAGADVAVCSDATTYKLPSAPTNMTWNSVSTNPTGVQINATTGDITGLTSATDYRFVLTNVAGCTDTVKITRKAVPSFDVVALQATCSTGAANADAKLNISGLDLANKYDYSEGISYTGTKTFATATDIIATTTTVTLTNPTADKSYTVRVFNANGCTTDKTVILKTRVCECKPDVCIPYSFKKTK